MTGSLEDYYVTFLDGHPALGALRRDARRMAQANMLRFNYFADRGAFSRDRGDGRYQGRRAGHAPRDGRAFQR